MKKISIISGHPDLENSVANKAILSALQKDNNVSITNVIKNYPNYEIDAELEINKLLQSDVIVLQFPFHWYGVPAILKKWIDSITTPLVYGTNKGGLKGKKFLISTTTGGPQESYQASGYNKYTMKELLLPLLKLGDSLGMDVLDPLVLHEASSSHENIQQRAREYASRLMDLIN